MSFDIESDSLEHLLAKSPYQGYTYSYPHKTAHRPLAPTIPLREVWADERRDALFLYIHVPFCEMRCGFCNLFALARADNTLIDRYVTSVRVQADRVRAAIGPANFARFAVGGGTPTWLSERQLERLLEIPRDVMGADLLSIPVSVEVSPATVTAEKLRLLRESGVDRISIGVQSFVDGDVRAMGRRQQRDSVERALDLIRAADFPILNVDLMYGAETETADSWQACVNTTLSCRPEEIFLYPLYVRPLTGLGKRTRSWDDRRLSAYRAGRSVLVEAGYRQVSMRMFRSVEAAEVAGPVYSCQEDGMVGLGCGARSYTRELHYSSDYAVPSTAVRRILEQFVQREPASFDVADHGIWLDEEDQQRRYAILSLLQEDGLSQLEFRTRFGLDPFQGLGQLRELQQHGLAQNNEGRIRLTPAGLERSDAIGPWLYSEKVRRRMENYQWRHA